MEATREVIAGTVGGVAGILATQPLDIIRVRQQTAAASHTRSALTHALDIVKTQGVRGFFAGVAAPVLANAPINAIIFAVESEVMRRLRAAETARTPVRVCVCVGTCACTHTRNPSDVLVHTLQHVCAGSLAGLAQVPISCPSEYVKLQLQLARRGPRSLAAFVCVCVREHGVRAMFTGLTATAVRDTSAFGIYFGTYFSLRTALCGGVEAAEAPIASLMLSGGAAGVASWLFTYPVDVWKSMVQAQPPGAPRAPSGFVSVMRAARQRTGGWRFLTHGLASTCMRAFPCSAITFPVFEYTLEMLNSPAPHSHQDDLHTR